MIPDFDKLFDEYQTQPPCGEAGYAALWEYVEPRAAVIRAELLIIESDTDDPYDNVAQLITDVRQGVLRLGPTVEHPFWSPEQQRSYRAWHDVEGHAVHVLGFDRYGEVEVLRKHVQALLSARCRLSGSAQDAAACAVFNEILHRVACGVAGEPDTPHRPVHLGEYGRRILDALATV